MQVDCHYPYAVPRCRGCNAAAIANSRHAHTAGAFCGGISSTQRRIWKASRTSPSLYTSVLTAQTVRGGLSNAPLPENAYVNWNQMSDRTRAGIEKTYQPRHRTRHRPGGTRPAGAGVDVKHGSYDRYLNRKKGNLLLRSSTDPCPVPKAGNKRSAAYVRKPCECPPQPPATNTHTHATNSYIDSFFHSASNGSSTSQ